MKRSRAKISDTEKWFDHTKSHLGESCDKRLIEMCKPCNRTSEMNVLCKLCCSHFDVNPHHIDVCQIKRCLIRTTSFALIVFVFVFPIHFLCDDSNSVVFILLFFSALRNPLSYDFSG